MSTDELAASQRLPVRRSADLRDPQALIAVDWRCRAAHGFVALNTAGRASRAGSRVRLAGVSATRVRGCHGASVT